jgi:hypothetical protein
MVRALSSEQVKSFVVERFIALMSHYRHLHQRDKSLHYEYALASVALNAA